jgi:hypothetical protein
MKREDMPHMTNGMMDKVHDTSFARSNCKNCSNDISQYRVSLVFLYDRKAILFVRSHKPTGYEKHALLP